MADPLVVDAASAPRPLKVVGEEITVLASGPQTGSYEIFHQAGPEGSGPPPHSHPWDEAFYVISGEIDFGVDERALTAKPGTLVHLPAGTTHWFRFRAGGGSMVSITSRAGAAAMFTEFDREIAPDKPDLARLVEIGQAHGLTVPPPPG
jgi:quercetin dioxygenase-like cupin family protein